jgi:type I restriction enzyme S subunit
MMMLKTISNLISEPWKLPNQWAWIPLEDICDIAIGGTPSTTNPQYWGNGHIWLSISDLNGEVIENSKKQITDMGVANSNVKLVQAGTVLMSFKLTIGKLGIAGTQLYTNEAIAALPIKSNWRTRFDSNFLFYALKIIPLSNQVDLSAKGRTLNKKKIARILIPIPYANEPILSIKTQRAIVAHIETLINEVKESHSLINKMRQDAERVLAVALNEIFTNLESVIDIVPFSEVATSFNGRASGEGNSNVRVFKTKHVYPHYFRLNNPSYMKAEQAEKMTQDRYLQPGDVLMANIAEGTLGRVSYVNKCENSWTVDTQIMILRSKDDKKLLGKWLYYYLWSEQGQREILSKRTGIAFAEKRGQTHIYPKDVAKIRVLLPPIDEQYQAVAYLDKIQYEIEEILKILQQDAQSLDMIEKSILERAFRGEL